MWRKVDTSNADLGSLSDSMFCGLEEIDWRDYKANPKARGAKVDIHIGSSEDKPCVTITYEEAVQDGMFSMI